MRNADAETTAETGEPCAVKVARTVRRGAVGKGLLNREQHLAGGLPYRQRCRGGAGRGVPFFGGGPQWASGFLVPPDASEGGRMNVWWNVSFWKPITSGKRRPGRSCTSKISSTAVWNSSRAMTWPVRRSTT